ncbi:MAG: restriction endonuclease [Candidatus Methanoperedens sp.]|nr:restriction endonuclease [Candidatus Methanoperedens sp.]
MEINIEERRVAIEAIATLVNIKATMAELILKPAGVPWEIYRPLLNKRNESTGQQLSKREIAPLILDAVEKRADGCSIICAMIKIAANWKDFHLAQNEFNARATVQKAREVLNVIEIMDAKEAQEQEIARRREIERMKQERASQFTKQLDLLLMMFDDLAKSQDAQKRGFLLQELLNQTFDLCEIPVVRSFMRNDGAEQIDGAFKLEGWHYLVECRWRKKLANIRELDGLKGQVDRSGKQTMGLFISIEGWSENVQTVLKQNPDKSIILMDGLDLRTVLSGYANLQEFLLAKIAKLNLQNEPFLGITDYLKEREG